MKVLSLFDGISCGRVALERAGIPVEKYVAYEIDKYAVEVSKRNYPDIIQCGDVTNADFTQYQGFDLLIGGSPCTYWSVAKKNRETTPDGIGGQLFLHYVRALKESGCKYFLYENNYSIHQDIKDYISQQLGVQPVMINSALVSAQQRKRCYWTNIPNVTQPADKGIVLKDIIINDAMVWQDKSYCITATYGKADAKNMLEKHQRTMLAEPIILNTTNNGTKSQTFIAGYNRAGLETLISNYNGMTAVVTKPEYLGHIGKTNGQANRVFSIRGKSVCLTAQAGGLGAKTGLYHIDLPDGDYIIRKLTPIEAERLQTLPDNYTAGISNTQRYKCIGNGWTVDVISHILQGLKSGGTFGGKS